MFTGISARNLFLYPRGGSFPRFHGYIRGNPFPVPARWCFSALPRVYPRVIFPCTRAATLFRASAGIFARFLSLYPRGSSFPRFHGYIRGNPSPVPARQLFSALPRVYPRVFFPYTRADFPPPARTLPRLFADAGTWFRYETLVSAAPATKRECADGRV